MLDIKYLTGKGASAALRSGEIIQCGPYKVKFQDGKYFLIVEGKTYRVSNLTPRQIVKILLVLGSKAR
jgi:hypothetical protein